MYIMKIQHDFLDTNVPMGKENSSSRQNQVYIKKLWPDI